MGSHHRHGYHIVVGDERIEVVVDAVSIGRWRHHMRVHVNGGLIGTTYVWGCKRAQRKVKRRAERALKRAMRKQLDISPPTDTIDAH